ncbi:MAG: hypothetical protein AB1487_00960 [Thermodesulfobacteriota bacterium]
MDIVHYYRNPAILTRILEFLGVYPELLTDLSTSIDLSRPLADSIKLKELLCAATTEYISAYGHRLLETNHRDHASMKPFRLGWTLDNGLDIHRSIWDQENALGVLDVEYFSKSFPGEPYLAPERTFGLMEPVYQGILDVFKSYGLAPLVITTGQGYNFDVLVSKNNPVFGSLASLGHVEETLKYDYSHPSPKRGRAVPEEDAKAFDAMGKLFEFLCHRILAEVSVCTPPIPIVVGDVVCGNEKREAISLDLSLYTNPLHTRSIRCPFSAYSKHMLRGDVLGDIVARHVGYLFSVPRQLRDAELPLTKILDMRTNAEETVHWAESVTAYLPDQPRGMARLINGYKKSRLYAFHLEYDAARQDNASGWPRGYDRLDLSSIPPCVGQSLRCPNPLLLQPTNLRTIVRVLMAIGWHPKHIAGLAYSKYARDFGWDVNFRRYDANRWANVWVRIYAGMIITGVDGLLDLNCISQQEKGEAWMGMRYCPAPNCGCNLADYRAMLERKI